MRCPNCGSSARRSHRRGLRERIKSSFGVLPYRCMECYARFWQRDGGSGRLVSVDMLRGIAVLAVLVSHLPFSKSLGSGAGLENNVSVFPSWLVNALSRGHAGVNLFLVISGFCIHARFARGERVSFASFWGRRLRRLYPPYFVALVGTLIGGVIMAKIAHVPMHVSAVDVLLLVLLLQNFNGAAERIGNRPFWTLALEEQLYLLYFPLLWMRRRYGWLITLAVVILVTSSWRLFGGPYELGPSRWIEWTLGAVAVEAHLGVVTLPKWCRSAPVAVVLLVVAFASNQDPIYGVAFFAVMNIAVANESQASRIMAFVGTWSYSLYLTHEPVMVAAKAIGLKTGSSVAEIVALRLVVPMVVAMLFHVVIERRFMTRPAPTHAQSRPM